MTSDLVAQTLLHDDEHDEDYALGSNKYNEEGEEEHPVGDECAEKDAADTAIPGWGLDINDAELDDSVAITSLFPDVSAGFSLCGPKVEAAFRRDEEEAEEEEAEKDEAEEKSVEQDKAYANDDEQYYRAEISDDGGAVDGGKQPKRQRLTGKTSTGKQNMLKQRPAAATRDGDSSMQLNILKRPAAAPSPPQHEKGKATGKAGAKAKCGNSSQGNLGNAAQVNAGTSVDAGNRGQVVSSETSQSETVRRDMLKSRKFYQLLDNDMLPKIIRDEYEIFEKSKSTRGYPYRKRLTELIEGTITKGGPNGGCVVDNNSPYAKALYTKRQQRFMNESFDCLIWEQACQMCGGEAALLSAIERKKCVKRNPNDAKSDIWWPKVSVGKETVWGAEEQFHQRTNITDDAFGMIGNEFASLEDEGFQGLVDFVAGINSGSSSSGLPALPDGSVLSPPSKVKDPNHEQDLMACEVDGVDNARNELSEQLVQMTKTDGLVDKLLTKAQDCRPNNRLERAVAELLATQDALQDMGHLANKLYKFRKRQDGKPATALDFKNSAATLRDQISIMVADTKSVRCHMPKQTK